MSDETPTKFKMKLGAAEIEFEGNPEFLKTEIMPTVEKILGMVESRADLQRTSEPPIVEQPKLQDGSIENKSASPPAFELPNENAGRTGSSLPSYLKLKNADNNETRRMLAAAGWLHIRGAKELTRSLVVDTLRETQQSKFSNPSKFVSENVSKGFCERTKTGFFVTPEGWQQLGESQ